MSDFDSKKIIDFVRKAQREELLFEEIYQNSTLPTGKNEFLFFIKPEITLNSQSINLESILRLIQEKMWEFDLAVHNVKVLAAKYLDEFKIVAQHYGVINKIATNASQNMSDSAKEKFMETYGHSVETSAVIGGAEILSKFPELNAYSIDYLWQNLENTKLAGGTYCELVKIDNLILYLVNGFHPRQLKHFTEKGRSIVVFTLSGDLPWSVARREFTGTTNPTSALSGSLRRELLERKDEFGLSEVSQGNNGVHLSAGPVEGLIELRRYNSNFAVKGGIKEYSSFSMGAKLVRTFSPDALDNILANTKVAVAGKLVSVFDLTEEMDSDEALAVLEAHF